MSARLRAGERLGERAGERPLGTERKVCEDEACEAEAGTTRDATVVEGAVEGAMGGAAWAT